MTSTEDKDWWCKHGSELEKEFVDLTGPQFSLNPDKTYDKYTYDLLYRGEPADLKSVRTPFFSSGQYGCDPSHTVTFNLKDLHRYQEYYPNITVVFWVVWPSQARFGISVDSIDGVWCYSLDEIATGDAPVHSYQRRRNDTTGNAKSSLLIQLGEQNRINRPYE